MQALQFGFGGSMSFLSYDAVAEIHRYGYGAVAVAVGIEGLGIPFPGETSLVAAAAYAGATHRLDVFLVIAAAVAGAMVGDNLGFWIGRRLGYPFIVRFGPRLHLTEPRIKIGQYLFLRYGRLVVFVGRFFTILRTLAGFLAGANRMAWPRFVLADAAGAVVWASVYGAGAYLLGGQIRRILGPAGLAFGGAALVFLIACAVLLRRHHRALEAAAERALPGPLAGEGRSTG